jgi:hypothetical protein
MRVGGQRYAPAALLPGHRPGTRSIGEAGWAPGPVWTGAEKSHPPPSHGFYRLTVQSIASRCIDWALPTTHYSKMVHVELKGHRCTRPYQNDLLLLQMETNGSILPSVRALRELRPNCHGKHLASCFLCEVRVITFGLSCSPLDEVTLCVTESDRAHCTGWGRRNSCVPKNITQHDKMDVLRQN